MDEAAQKAVADAVLAIAREVGSTENDNFCRTCGGAGDFDEGKGDGLDPCMHCCGSGLRSKLARRLRGLRFKWLHRHGLFERYLAEKYGGDQ